MKRKILIIVLGLVILSQVPFMYRRYRLRRLNNSIQQMAAQRLAPSTPDDYVDYQGAVHVHSSLGGHSHGTFAELIAAAKANQLDFVIMTEHPQADFDTAEMTLSGMHAGVLFIGGNEVLSANGDRLLLIPGNSNAASSPTQTTQHIVDQQKQSGGLAFAAYPSESQNWRATVVDGIEVYNLFTNARQNNSLVMFFDGLWSYGSYADLMFANFYQRPSQDLRDWDQAISESNRRLVAIAGNDAHANVGLSLYDRAGNQLLGAKLDPYERSFRIVRTHVLIRKDKALTRESLLEAISLGHCYVSFDIFGAPAGFHFSVSNSDKIMGDEVSLSSQPTLSVRTPLTSRATLFRNGTEIGQKSGTAMEFSADAAGAYRVEINLDSLPPPATGGTWILSNPIYVR